MAPSEISLDRAISACSIAPEMLMGAGADQRSPSLSPKTPYGFGEAAYHSHRSYSISPEQTVPCNSRGVRPKSTMQMLSDSVYKREVERLSSASSASRSNRPAIKQPTRPYSADMALSLRAKFNPFETTYGKEYYQKESEELYGRPQPHLKLSAQPLRDETTYNKEYNGAKTTPNISLWSGGNNPHPSQAFMAWKYPTKQRSAGADNSDEPVVPTLTNDVYDKVMRGKSKSTYQMDYKGLPPGYMPAEFDNVPSDWKSRVPYTLDSNQRISYQHPNQPKPLNNNTDRFGHSANDRHRLLVGIAPNASRRKATINHRTTYHRHFNELAPHITHEARIHFPTHARTVIKGKGAEELSALYEDIKHRHRPRHMRTPSLNGYCNEIPIVNPDSGVPRVSPGAGVVPIPEPSFITTPVPEPICEPV